MKSVNQLTKLLAFPLFADTILKKEFTIKNGQIARVNLRKGMKKAGNIMVIV